MLVEIDDEAMFLNDPEFFDFLSEAEDARAKAVAKKPAATFVVLRCEEVDS